MIGSADAAKNETIVLGTVQGDIDDIGKDIVSLMSTSTASRSSTWAWTCPRRPS